MRGGRTLGRRECWVSAGTKGRGQRGRMYGHSLGNVTAKSEKVRGTENKLDAFFFFFFPLLIAMPLKRGVSLSQNHNSRLSDGDITSAGGNFV